MSMVKFLNNYPILTILLVLWMVGITSFVIYGTFFIVPEIGAGLAAVVGTVFGLPAVVFGFVQWRFSRKDGDD